MPDRLCSFVLYMSGNKSIVPGIKREIKSARTEQLCWHVLHPDAATEGFGYPSSGMVLCCYLKLVLFCRVYFDLSSNLAENFV